MEAWFLESSSSSSTSSSSDEDEYVYSLLREERETVCSSDDAMNVCETSSSSSDDDAMFYNLKRSKPKIRNYIEEIVNSYTDLEFKQTFRVGRQMAERLISAYQQSEFHPSGKGLGGSACNSAEEDILSFLWFAGNKCCLRDVSERFGTGLVTCFNQHLRVMQFLLHIAPNIIKFPDNKEEASQKFKQISGFPDVIGCIDGSHIPIRTPAGKIKHTYVNRHDWPSLTLQAICDADKKFIDVFTGVPGKMHDARVLQFSDINHELPEICGGQYHLLGDGAYALRPWLLVPYKDLGHMTHEERVFNSKFCATRVIIENAFGLLKGRFRQLALLIDMHRVDKMSKFIISCCVLHNLCIDEEDVYDFAAPVNELENEHPEQNNIADADMALRAAGAHKRNLIKQSFI